VQFDANILLGTDPYNICSTVSTGVAIVMDLQFRYISSKTLSGAIAEMQSLLPYWLGK
jgi:hypothetical protein